jgi:hypothetical protein
MKMPPHTVGQMSEIGVSSKRGYILRASGATRTIFPIMGYLLQNQWSKQLVLGSDYPENVGYWSNSHAQYGLCTRDPGN